MIRVDEIREIELNKTKQIMIIPFTKNEKRDGVFFFKLLTQKLLNKEISPKIVYSVVEVLGKLVKFKITYNKSLNKITYFDGNTVFYKIVIDRKEYHIGETVEHSIGVLVIDDKPFLALKIERNDGTEKIVFFKVLPLTRTRFFTIKEEISKGETITIEHRFPREWFKVLF